MYQARRMLPDEILAHPSTAGTGLFCVEHDSGKLVVVRLSWLEACNMAAQLSLAENQPTV